ncbi:MAG TPA: Smr/MutS family protein [Terriglobia bacterium]|nr:Smr/MutS family protein [Terriglobia bacterium]
MLNNSFSLEALEFPAILEMLRPLLSGPVGHYLLASFGPNSSRSAIEDELARVDEAREYLVGSSRPSLSGLNDVRPILDKVQVQGVTCEALEILRVVEVARAAREIRPFFVKTPFTRLDQMAAALPDFRELLTALDGKILPDGSVDSSASPKLAALRRSMERMRHELQATLERLVHRLDREKLLQDAVVTLRNDRFVIPVKSDEKRRVEGIVHGSSSSGASVFVEPLETVPLNNELVELRDQEFAEVQRILAEFSARLRDKHDELTAAVDILARLDLVFAKAEFARRYDCCIPQFTEDREFHARDLRHPLLIKVLGARGQSPVPFSLELVPPHTMLVISGPNTGGKTATLKSIGIAALMAQSGMPVAAKEARLPWFDHVLADIGDRQSMEQDLSTFSSHLENIRAIVSEASARDLVLLDELGGSTDPTEGEVLAVALLERFLRVGPITVVTTHFSGLKTFAAGSGEALNAAMDFDEATFRPTYRLSVGLPGKSSGLDIAQRLGLDAEIVDRARAMLDPASRQASSLLDFLHTKKHEMERQLEQAHQHELDLEKRAVELERQYENERRKRLKDLDQRLEETLRRQEKRWQEAIEEIRRQALAEGKQPGKAGLRAQRQGSELAREGREAWNAQVLETLGGQSEGQPSAEPIAPVEIGDQVRVAGFPTPGVVIALPDEAHAEVEVGRIRMKVEKERLQIMVRGGKTAPVFSRVAGRQASAALANPGKSFHPASARPSGAHSPALPAGESDPLLLAPGSEINVIGATAEEAMDLVDKFLDDAYLDGRLRLRVIHGHGKGILRKNLHEMFESHPHVEKFYAAAPRDGGTGATIVELKA